MNKTVAIAVGVGVVGVVTVIMLRPHYEIGDSIRVCSESCLTCFHINIVDARRSGLSWEYLVSHSAYPGTTFWVDQQEIDEGVAAAEACAAA